MPSCSRSTTCVERPGWRAPGRDRDLHRLGPRAGTSPARRTERSSGPAARARRVCTSTPGNPQEVAYGAARSGWSTAEQLGPAPRGRARFALRNGGRDPGGRGAAPRICPGKIPTAEWARIITEAHRVGVPSTATIMYGTGESVADRIEHLGVLRDIQDETGGFTEFVPLSFVHLRDPALPSQASPRPAPPGARTC